MNPIDGNESRFIHSSTDAPLPDHLSSFIDLASDALVTFDSQGKITFWNPAAERIYGWTVSEALGKNSDELFLPLNLDQDQKEQKPKPTELESGTTLHGEYEARRKDGSFFWVEFTTRTMFDNEGRVLEYVTVYRDINEYKRITKELERIEDEIGLVAKMPSENPNPVMRMTPDGEVVYANAASKPLLDFWKQHTGQTISGEVQISIQDAFESGSKRVIEVEYDGKTLSCTLAPVQETGHVNFYGSDITARKKVEKTLLQARAHAERARKRVLRLQKVTAALSEAVTTVQVAEVLVKQGIPTMNATSGTVMTLSEDGLVLEILHTSTPDTVTSPYQKFSVSMNVPAANAVRSGKPVWIKSRQEFKERYPHIVGQIDTWDLQAAVAIPLIVKERNLGVLTLSFEQAQEFTPGDQDFILTLAQQGAQALERAQLYRQTEQALAELQMTYDQSPIGMIQLDTDLRYIRINETLARMNGIPAKEHIGKSIREIVPDLAIKIEEGFREVIESGEPRFNIEVVGETEAEPGVPHTWLESWYPLREEDGTVVGLNIVVQDITNRKRDEHDLAEFARQQEALYKLVNKLHRTNSLEGTFDAALDAILSALQCDRASILLFDQDGVMRFVAWRGLSATYRKATDGHSPWEPGMKNPLPIYFNDIDSADLEDALKAVVKAEGINSLAFIPLVFDGKLIGKFMTYFDKAHEFSGNEVDLSLIIAHQLAFGIQRKQAEAALRESEGQLQALNESLEQRVREQTAEVRNLASDLTRAEQRERHRIAYILHEDLQQRFYALRMQIESLFEEVIEKNASFQEDFNTIEKQSDEMMALIRHLSVDLSPPILHDEGLTQAVEWLASQMREQYGLKVDLLAEESFAIADEDVQMLLFSCIRELLFNVVKHSEVKDVVVSLERQNGNFHVEIRDEGRGFDVKTLANHTGRMDDENTLQPRSFGLPTIRHRLSLFGGQMEIHSVPQAGTSITITIPIET